MNVVKSYNIITLSACLDCMKYKLFLDLKLLCYVKDMINIKAENVDILEQKFLLHTSCLGFYNKL